MSTPPRPAPFVLLVTGLLAGVVFFVGLAVDLPTLRLVTKSLPALSLAVWVQTRRRDPTGRLVTAGLVFSAASDLLLERGLFLPGLVGFLFAHLAYVAGFLGETTRPALGRALPVALWCGLVLALLWPRLEGLAPPVTLYVIVIGAMMWRAAARVGSPEARRAHGSPAPATAGHAWLGLAGAVFFGLSDTLLALDRFVVAIPGVRWPIMLFYWAGQWAIAASFCRLRGDV